MLVLLLLVVGAFAADRPEGKSGKRIDKIEKDFAVKFIQVADVSIDGKKAPYWMFGHIKDDVSPSYTFTTPANPTDAQVQNCMVSSNATAIFYLSIIGQMMAHPSPTPTNLL